MGIDIRLPLGLLFLLLGTILLVYGALGDPSLYQQSLGINVNLYWGVVLFAFGGLMFALSRRSLRAATAVRASGTPPAPGSSSR